MDKSETLEEIIQHSLEKFSLLNEESWNKKTLPGKWSRKEILGHLCDSAMNNIRRFVVSQYEENNLIVYRQDDWVALQDYQSADIKDIITLWKLLNEQILRISKKIPAGKLNNNCNTPEPHTIGWLMEDYITHLKHHLDQILIHD
jgi:hypothetical protein